MAAVTLKDLMSPLSKIEAYSKETSESVKRIEDFIVKGMGSAGSADATSAAILSVSQQQLSVLQNIRSLIGQHLSVAMRHEEGSRSFAGDSIRQALRDRILGNRDSKNLEILAKNAANKSSGKDKTINKKSSGKIDGKAAAALKELGYGALLTGKAMLVWSIVPKRAVNKFLDFVVNSFERFESFNTKKVQKGVDALDSMGDAIIKFAAGLALATPLILIGLVGLPILIPTLFIMGGVFSLLGNKKFSKNIRKGARSVDRMGDAILSFGIGMAAFALTTYFILKQPAILLGMVLSLVLIGGAVALLGTKAMSKKVRRGSLNLLIMGAAVGVFGIGYGIFAAAFPKNVGFKDVLIQAAAIAGIGIATAIVGKFGLTNIALGALSLALNGLALLVFNMGYVPFADATKGMSLGDVGIQSGVLIAVGGIMALAGLAVAASAGTVLLGPALYGAAGLALQELAPGLKAMKDLEYSEQDSKDLATVLGAVAAAFSGVDPEAGFMKNVGNVFSRIGQSIGGGSAAAMYISAGKALQELSKGLADFKAIGFTEEDSKELAIALGSVSGAFAQAGGEPASPGGLFGAIFGNTFSPNATERGIDSVMDSGKALMEITKGLGAFLDLKKKYKLDGDAFKEGGYLNTAITETLGFLNSAFAAIGTNETSDSWGIFSWDENNVEKGIDAVKGSGKALKDITEGLKGFLDLKNNYGLTSESFMEGGFLYTAVTDSLGFISKAFATIGGEETEDSWGPFRWDENKVEKGIDAVSGAGKELMNIAEGLSKFQELVKAKVDFSKGGALEQAVTNSLTFVGDAFAVIGGKEEEDGWFIFSWDENLVEKGVDAVQGAGEELMNIATGLETFQKLIDQKVDWDKLKTSIVNSVTFVGDAFSAVGGMKETDSSFFGLITWDENLVEEGIDAVKGAGEELINIAKGIEAFAGIKNPAKVAKSISSIFNNIADTFQNLYNPEDTRSRMSHFRVWITNLTDAAKDNSLAKAADDMQELVNAINSTDIYKAEALGNLFKGAGELSRNRRAYNDLYRAVEDIRDLLAKSGGGGGEDVPAGGGEGTPPKDSGNSAAFTKLNSTLSRLNSTMSSLPAAIQSIKIEIPD